MGIKITRKLLNNYRRYQREIPLLEAELKEMMVSDSGIGNSTIFDYRSGFPVPQSVVGFDWPLYERRQKTLERKKAEVEAVKHWIEAIEDGQTRYVFRARYIYGLNWTTIAQKTGYSGSPDYPRLYIRDTYLKKHGIL